MKHIDSSVSKMKAIIKRGKLKHKKIKIKKEVLDKLVSPEIREKIKGADNVLKIERKAINKDKAEELLSENKKTAIKRFEYYKNLSE